MSHVSWVLNEGDGELFYILGAIYKNFHNPGNWNGVACLLFVLLIRDKMLRYVMLYIHAKVCYAIHAT